MRIRTLACVVAIGASAAGCDFVFDIAPATTPIDGMPQGDGPAGSTQPVHKTSGQFPDTGAAVPLNIPLTTDGNVLVVTAVIRSTDQGIAEIQDTGGNSWTEAVHGLNSSDVAIPLRVEIWFANATSPANQIEITTTANRPIGISYSEWNVFQGMAVVPASATKRGDLISNLADTGAIMTTGPSLVVATTAADLATQAQLQGPRFTELNQTNADDVDAFSAATLVKAVETVTVGWTLNVESRWNAAIVALAPGM